jgi:hypothetical protein
MHVASGVGRNRTNRWKFQLPTVSRCFSLQLMMLQEHWWLYGIIFILNIMFPARVPIKHHGVLRRDRDTVAEIILGNVVS